MLDLILNANTSNDQKPEQYIEDGDEKIILSRTIFCCISFTCSLLLIIVYIINCIQVKYRKCIRNEEKVLNENENNYSDMDNKEDENSNKKNNQGKIGLGSNFMFFMTISNFFGALFEFSFYFYYINLKSKEENQDLTKNILYYNINEDNACTLFGFAHNFFDLFTCCWITMLTLLFYRSTNISNDMPYHEAKYLTIGFAYCIILCIILCVIPLSTGSYGFARYYCSFKYNSLSQKGEYYIKDPEGNLDKVWRYAFIAVASLNNIVNVIWLYLTNNYYSKKLKKIKNQNKNEYKIMLYFVWVFRIFPIVLIISRFYKGVSRMLLDNVDSKEVIDIIQYINGFLFASNGIFDSIACIFFFRGVFWCCNSPSISRAVSEEKVSDMDVLEGDQDD
jgi:hypothetical protein